MIEKFKDYEEIKKVYPKTMSKDQFYKVAHISKSTALFLLQTGLVPCKDSKKKTRRYTIKTKDVISYMQERIVSPEKFRAADGWYLTRSGYGKSKDTGKDKLMSLTPEQCELLRQYFENELTDYNDVMTTYELATFLGYCRTSVIRWCNQKQLKSFSISGSLLIPKISAAEFLASPKAHCINTKSFRHKLFIEDFYSKYQI